MARQRCYRQEHVQCDIVPYWVFSAEGEFQVERHVYASPLSRESAQIDDLRKSLAVYRMVFGQPRQADLLKYLLHNLPQDKIKELSEALKIDLSPPQF